VRVDAFSNAKEVELLQLLREYAAILVLPSPQRAGAACQVGCALRFSWGAARTPRWSPCPRPICHELRPGLQRGRGGLARPPLVLMGQPQLLPLVPVGKRPPLLTRRLAGMRVPGAQMARGIRQHTFELQPARVQAVPLTSRALAAVEHRHSPLQHASCPKARLVAPQHFSGPAHVADTRSGPGVHNVSAMIVSRFLRFRG
jgi:hypothetical protein